MAATVAATLVAPSARSASQPDEPSPRSRLSALLVLCRFGTIAAVLLAAASFPQSSFFTIRDIRVDGIRQISVAGLVALTRLRVGDQAFAVSAAEVARRIATHPRVQSADVRITPTGHVLIRITERAAAAAVPFRGRFIVVDPVGVAIAERDDPGELPVIAADGADLPWLRLGVAVPSVAIPQSIRILAELPRELPRGGLVLRRSPAGDLSMMTSDRIVVRLGRSRGLRERAAVLPEVLATIRRRQIAVEYLDLRFAGNIILMPAGTADGAGVGP